MQNIGTTSASTLPAPGVGAAPGAAQRPAPTAVITPLIDMARGLVQAARNSPLQGLVDALGGATPLISPEGVMGALTGAGRGNPIAAVVGAVSAALGGPAALGIKPASTPPPMTFPTYADRPSSPGSGGVTPAGSPPSTAATTPATAATPAPLGAGGVPIGTPEPVVLGLAGAGPAGTLGLQPLTSLDAVVHDHVPGPADVAGATPADVAKATTLAEQTQAESRRYEDISTAIADGFTQSVYQPRSGWLHLTNPSRLTDASVADPKRAESLLYHVDADGSTRLYGSMFLKTKGEPAPDVGTIPNFHEHPATLPGLEMVHVWNTPDLANVYNGGEPTIDAMPNIGRGTTSPPSTRTSP